MFIDFGPIFCNPSGLHIDQWVTIGGHSAAIWQWQEGIEISQAPSPEEQEIMRQENLVASSYPVWRFTRGEGFNPDAPVTMCGRTRPADCWIGSWTREPTADEAAIFAAANINVTPSTVWFVCEPREDDGGWE